MISAVMARLKVTVFLLEEIAELGHGLTISACLTVVNSCGAHLVNNEQNIDVNSW